MTETTKKLEVRCKFGKLIPLSVTGCKTGYILVDKHNRMTSGKLRCGHGIVKPHCRQCGKHK